MTPDLSTVTVPAGSVFIAAIEWRQRRRDFNPRGHPDVFGEPRLPEIARLASA